MRKPGPFISSDFLDLPPAQSSVTTLTMNPTSTGHPAPLKASKKPLSLMPSPARDASFCRSLPLLHALPIPSLP